MSFERLLYIVYVALACCCIAWLIDGYFSSTEKCPECGQRVTTSYCTNCGTELEDHKSTCIECGIECDTPFCGACGAHMNSEG